MEREEEWQSYRLPDSLCNGAVKPFTIVIVVVCGLPDVATSTGEVGHSENRVSQSMSALIDGVKRIFAQGPFLSFDETPPAPIVFMIQ